MSVEVEGRQGANSGKWDGDCLSIRPSSDASSSSFQVIFLGTPDNLEKAREAVAELSRSQRDSNR